MAQRLIPDRRGWRRWPHRLAADKGYSYPRIRIWCNRRRIKAVIPTRSNQPREPRFDKAAYRRRNMIERVVGRYKDYRGLATRYEKLAVNYLALWLVAIMDQALKRLFKQTLGHKPGDIQKARTHVRPIALSRRGQNLLCFHL